jgi:signal transduction histidine kinase
LKDRLNRLWFPTNKGVVVIDPDKLPVNRFLPSVKIEQVKIDKKEIVPGYSGKALTQFPPGDGNLEFQYTGLSLLVPEKVKFQYKLDGFDSRWIDADTRRTAYYTNIPVGTYTFRVIACNNDGLWNPTGASFLFTLTPHFYQTSWFYSLCLAGIVAGVFAIYRLRIRQVKAQFEAVLQERNRISREIHDTLTQDFTAVILHLEAAEMTLQDSSEETRNLLNYARNLARSGLVESRRFVRELRPAVLEKGNLTDAILDVAQQTASGTALKVDMDVTGPRRPLSPEIEDNLVRIVREASTNAVKHSAAKNLRIELRYKMRKVDLEIIDDGCGFDLGNIPRIGERFWPDQHGRKS